MFIMNLGSPWSVAIAMSFLRQKHSVCIAGVDQGLTTDGYLRSQDAVFGKELGRLCELDGLTIASISSDGNAIRKWAIAALDVRAVVKRFRPDAVISLYGGYLGYLLLISGAAVKLPYMVGSDLLAPGVLRNVFNRILFSASKFVLCNGKHMANCAARLCDPTKVRSVYVGLDSSEFPESHASTSAKTIICTRGFTDLYNNEYIIEALGLINLAELDVSVVFTSKGPNLAGSIALADKVLIKENRRRVTFLGGVSRAELIQRILGSDIYISMSLSDGSSVSLWEAMLSYSYPIVSDIPANREWHVGANLVLVPLDDVQKLADTIKEVILHYDRYREGTYLSRSMVLREANLDSNMATVAGLLG